MADESPIFRVPDGGTEINALGAAAPTFRHVSFRYEAVEHEQKSREAGRKVFQQALLMRTYSPGSKDTLDRMMLVWPEEGAAPVIMEPDLWRTYSDVAEKWMAKVSTDAVGTPLALLNLNVAAEAVLREVGVATVEALAAVPDNGLRNIEGGRGLRERARSFLAAQQDAAPLAAAEDRAKAAEDRAKAAEEEVAALRREMVSLRASLDELREAQPASQRGKRSTA